MNLSTTLRSRLLVAMGLTTLTAGSALNCGGGTESTDDSTGGTAGAAGSGASAGRGTGGDRGQGGDATTGGAASGGVSDADASRDDAGKAGAPGGGSGGASSSNGGSGSGHFCEPWPACATVRRPFLVGSSMRSSEVAERDDWLASVPKVHISHHRTAEFLAAAWLKDALEEHASVAAFARFTLLLLSVGAPPDLVIGSQRASLDEVRHARACFALARRYGASDVGPATLDVTGSLSPMSLAEIAGLTVLEGCVGETLGALMAEEQLRLATDPGVQAILQRIARDEARHAELAWRFLAWALQVGGESVQSAAQDAFRDATDELERMPIVDYGVDVALWHGHGRMTCAEARRLSRMGAERVISPCWEALVRAHT